MRAGFPREKGVIRLTLRSQPTPLPQAEWGLTQAPRYGQRSCLSDQRRASPALWCPAAPDWPSPTHCAAPASSASTVPSVPAAPREAACASFRRARASASRCSGVMCSQCFMPRWARSRCSGVICFQRCARSSMRWRCSGSLFQRSRIGAISCSRCAGVNCSQAGSVAGVGCSARPGSGCRQQDRAAPGHEAGGWRKSAKRMVIAPQRQCVVVGRQPEVKIGVFVERGHGGVGVITPRTPPPMAERQAAMAGRGCNCKAMASAKTAAQPLASSQP